MSRSVQAVPLVPLNDLPILENPLENPPCLIFVQVNCHDNLACTLGHFKILSPCIAFERTSKDFAAAVTLEKCEKTQPLSSLAHNFAK